MSTDQPRKPAGTPAGGEFANKTGSAPNSTLAALEEGRTSPRQFRQGAKGAFFGAIPPVPSATLAKTQMVLPGRQAAQARLSDVHERYNELVASEPMRLGPVDPRYVAASSELQAVVGEYVSALSDVLDADVELWRERIADAALRAREQSVHEWTQAANKLRSEIDVASKMPAKQGFQHLRSVGINFGWKDIPFTEARRIALDQADRFEESARAAATSRFRQDRLGMIANDPLRSLLREAPGEVFARIVEAAERPR